MVVKAQNNFLVSTPVQEDEDEEEPSGEEADENSD